MNHHTLSVCRTYLTSLFGFLAMGSLQGQQEVLLSPGALPGNGAANFRGDDLESALVGFSYGLNVNTTYVDNPELEESGGESRFYLSTGADFSYQTVQSDEKTFVGSISYSPSYRFYLSGRDLPGRFSQRASASLNYNGGAFSGALRGSYSSGGNENALADGFVDSSNLDLRGSLNWNYSPKTSLGVNASYRYNGFSSGDFEGSDSFSFGFSGSWQATPLIRIGPYFSFSSTDSNNAGSLDATGYGVTVSYQLSGKTSLAGSFGFRDQDFDQGGGSTIFVGNLNLSWIPNDLYSVNLGFNTRTSAAPTGTNQFANNYSLNLGVSRRLEVGSLSLNTGFNFSNLEATDEATVLVEDRRFFNVRLGYSRPILWEEVSFNTSVGYQKGYGGRKFSNFTLSCGLSYAF